MTMDAVARLALKLPETTEGSRWGNRTWLVRGKGYAWERPFTQADIKRFGEQVPPSGPILAVRVADLGEKEAVLAAHPQSLFTIAHFENYPAVLIQLDTVSKKVLEDTVVDGWLACAPESLIEGFLRRQGLRGR